MKKIIILLPILLLLNGCIFLNEANKKTLERYGEKRTEPVVEQPAYAKIKTISSPDKQVVVAVYDFPDLTGQRKDKDTASSFSNSVTQGGSALLIDALKSAGGGSWFKVVERTRLDDLTKERQLIRSTREEYQGSGSNKLEPLLFAGLLIQGGIVGYDTNFISGGSGARYLGIGMDRQYRRDQVTIALRAVSTASGEVLMNVQVTKTILSSSMDNNVFKFIDMGTRALEIESGVAENEANTKAVKMAIEAAVVAMIEQGIEKKYWSYKQKEVN
jgi:curli production assembly/transport component CsgG